MLCTYVSHAISIQYLRRRPAYLLQSSRSNTADYIPPVPLDHQTTMFTGPCFATSLFQVFEARCYQETGKGSRGAQWEAAGNDDGGVRSLLSLFRQLSVLEVKSLNKVIGRSSKRAPRHDEERENSRSLSYFSPYVLLPIWIAPSKAPISDHFSTSTPR